MEKSKRNYDFTKIIKPEHGGKWSALNLEQTTGLEYADTLKELQQKVRGRKVDRIAYRYLGRSRPMLLGQRDLFQHFNLHFMTKRGKFIVSKVPILEL